MDKNSPKHKLLILRISRLGKIPTAKSSAELFQEKGIPILVFEYGEYLGKSVDISGPLPRFRLVLPAVRFLPPILRSSATLLFTLLWLGVWFLRNGKPSLILTHGINEQALAWALGSVFQIPYACHVHEVYDLAELTFVNRVLVAIEKRALRNASFVVFPETSREVLYRKRYGFTCPAFIVANAPRRQILGPPADLRSELGLPQSSKLMAYMGGIGPLQVFEETLQALAFVPDIHFLLWGWGENDYVESLKNLAKTHGVLDRIHFLGQVDEAKWRALSGCDFSHCLYRPSNLRLIHAGTASNKLLEAFAAGLPVLVRGTPDFRDLVERYDLGECVTELTPESIAKSLQALIASESRLRERAKNARRLHLERYHYELQYAGVLNETTRFIAPQRGTEPLTQSQT